MLKVKVSYFYYERCASMVSQIGFGNTNFSPTMFSNPYLKDLESIVDNGVMPEINNNLTTDTFSFSETPQAANNSDGITNCLIDKDKNVAFTETGNRYKKTNKGKVGGAIIGTLAPIATKLLTKGAMKFKPLAIACSALGLAGAGAGALVDTVTNTKRAQSADENTVQIA